MQTIKGVYKFQIFDADGNLNREETFENRITPQGIRSLGGLNGDVAILGRLRISEKNITGDVINVADEIVPMLKLDVGKSLKFDERTPVLESSTGGVVFVKKDVVIRSVGIESFKYSNASYLPFSITKANVRVSKGEGIKIFYYLSFPVDPELVRNGYQTSIPITFKTITTNTLADDALVLAINLPPENNYSTLSININSWGKSKCNEKLSLIKNNNYSRDHTSKTRMENLVATDNSLTFDLVFPLNGLTGDYSFITCNHFYLLVKLANGNKKPNDNKEIVVKMRYSFNEREK